jgi:hypothetical protein
MGNKYQKVVLDFSWSGSAERRVGKACDLKGGQFHAGSIGFLSSQKLSGCLSRSLCLRAGHVCRVPETDRTK